MNRREMMFRSGAAALGLGLSGFPLGWARALADEGPKKRVLFFTKSSGFQHSAITEKDGKPGYAQKILTDLGEKHNFEVTTTKDGTVFNPENIAKYDAFFFYTTGDLTKAGTDKTPPMSPEGKAALFEAIKNGKGFMGTHSATDTFHSSGAKLDPYIEMLGGEFITHGSQQKAKLICTDPKFPGMGELKEGVELVDEWYSLKNFAKDMHVLLIQETTGMQGFPYERGQYPSTWARAHGKGRVFYTSMGHREDVWSNPVFQNILLGALSWTTGNVEADVTPNIETATPKYADMPPNPPPKKKEEPKK